MKFYLEKGKGFRITGSWFKVHLEKVKVGLVRSGKSKNQS